MTEGVTVLRESIFTTRPGLNEVKKCSFHSGLKLMFGTNFFQPGLKLKILLRVEISCVIVLLAMFLKLLGIILGSKE